MLAVLRDLHAFARPEIEIGVPLSNLVVHGEEI